MGRAVDRLRPVVMSAKNSKSESARTIFRKRDGAYVAVRDEGGVTRIYRLDVVKREPHENFVFEPDCARIVLVAAIANVATIAHVVENADYIPDLKNAVPELASSMRSPVRAIEDPLER
jgi:hypothetical protein